MRKTENTSGPTKVSRRDFGRSIAAIGMAGVIAKATPSLAASESDAMAGESGQDRSANQAARECDLLIKGGTVIDPSQHLHATMDVAVQDGKILEVSRGFPEGRARRVVSAEGKIVTPGLVDILAHIFEGVGVGGVNADLNCLAKGTTTVVDGGSVGYPMIDGFRKYVVNTSSTRVYELLDIGKLGLLVGAGSMENLEWVNPQLTAKAAKENKPVVVGIKVRLSDYVGTQDVEILKRALEAAEAARIPVLAHIDSPYSPLPDLVKMLRKGDIFTHFCTYHRHNVLDANGKLLPEVTEARQRGVLFDVGHGASHFSFDIAEKCLQQDFLPDTISSCLGAEHPYKSYEYAPDLPTVISKFLLLGLDLDRVVEMVTARPARVFDYGLELGTLRPGSEADISIFELREGKFILADNTGQKRIAPQRLFPVASIRSGALHIIEIPA